MIIQFFLLGLCVSGKHYIPYQAHGFNDIPYMLQLIKKGTTYFKFDISPADRESCIHYSNWNNENQCETFNNGFEICCLALRGDTSSLPIFKHYFNYTSEFIQAIRNHPQYFGKQANKGYEEKKVLVFNFQYGDKFTLMTKTLLYDMTFIMADYNVDIIIGSDAFLQEYINKCKTQQCDQMEQAIVNAPFKLQTDNSQQGTDLARNFNTFYVEIESLCNNGWPEWVDEYGIIFWEPSHEYQVQKCRQHFEDPKCKISDRLRHIEKIRIASNLEPETLQIYWKKPITTSGGFDRDQEKNIMFGHYKQPKIDYHEQCDNILFSYQTQNDVIIQLKDNSMNLIKQYDFPQSILKNMRIKNNNLMLQFEQEIQIFEINCQNLNYLYTDKLNNNQQFVTLIDDKYIILQLGDSYADFVIKQNQQILSQFRIQTGQISQQLLNLKFDAIFNLNQYYIAISFSKFEYILEKDQFKKIYITLLTLDQDFNVLEYTPAKGAIDYGITGDIKLSVYNDEVFLAQVGSDGMCQSAILLNNNEWNKCHQEKYIQFSALTSVEHMINYFWGKFTHIRDRINSKKLINGCDQQIMHAKLGNGDKPTLAIIKGEELFIVSEFVHFKKQGAFTQLFCGSSNDYNYEETSIEGIQQFTFDIVNPEQL